MILTPERYNFEFGPRGEGDGIISSGINGDQYRWDGRVVPYQFSPEISKMVVGMCREGHLVHS